MHFYRDFNPEFWIPNRLTFDSPPRNGEKPEGKGLLRHLSEDSKLPEIHHENENAKNRTNFGALTEIHQHLEQLKDTVEDGEPEKYLETFQKKPQFDAVSAFLAGGNQAFGTDSLFNFHNWLTVEPTVVANIFDGKLTGIIMPKGPGRSEFIAGLRNPDKNSEAFKKSADVMIKIVEALDKKSKEHQEATEDVTAQKEKTASGPIGETLVGGVETLMKNFKRGSSAEKMATLGALGVGIYILWKWWDKEWFPKISFKNIATVGGLLWGINYLSGKVSPDGKTVVQRLGVGLDLEDLKDNKLKAFAYEHGFAEDQEKYRAYLTLQTMDVRTLYRHYKNANAPGHKKEIDPAALGLKGNEIDGKSAYEVVDQLVKETSINMHLAERREEAEKVGKPYDENKDLANDTFRAMCTSPSEARDKFERKYLILMGDTKVTLLDAILNEFRGDTQETIVTGRAKRFHERAARTTADLAIKGLGLTKKYGAIGAGFVYEGGKDLIRFGKKHVAEPVGNFLKVEWAKYSPYLTDGGRDAEASLQEADLKKVLPDYFDVKVADSSSGKASVFGFPGIAFDIRETTDSAGKVKEIAKIDDSEFALEKGISGNERQALALETKIQARVEKIVRAKALSALAGKKPEWDKTQKKWFVRGISVTAFNGIGAATTDIEIKFSEDGNDVTFYDGNRKIENFGDLNVLHRNSLLEDEIKKEFAAIIPISANLNLPIEVRGEPRGNAALQEFTANVAGLELQLTRSVSGGAVKYEFADKLGTLHTLKDATIDSLSGNEKFLETLCGGILNSDEYKLPFLKLESLIEGTDESLWSKVKLMSLSGKVLQKQWKATSQFKMFEGIQIFRDQLAVAGKKVSDIESTYQASIKKTVEQAGKLASYIESVPNNQRPDKFQDFLSAQAFPPLSPNEGGGIEYINYASAEYREGFESFKKMITRPEYNYEGIDAGDVPGTDTYYEIYFTLLSVWSHYTRQFSLKDPLGAGDKAQMTAVTDRVKGILDKAMADGSGTIKKGNLPGACAPEAMTEWA